MLEQSMWMGVDASQIPTIRTNRLRAVIQLFTTTHQGSVKVAEGVLATCGKVRPTLFEYRKGSNETGCCLGSLVGYLIDSL